MTPDEFREACDACGWSPQTVALMCGRARNSGTDWASGRVSLPQEVAHWVGKMVRWMARNPPPVLPDRRLRG